MRAICRFSNIGTSKTLCPSSNWPILVQKLPKKCKDGDYKLLYKFFKNVFFLHEQSAVKKSFSTYVCYAPDGVFWLNLYNNESTLRIVSEYLVPLMMSASWNFRKKRYCLMMILVYRIISNNSLTPKISEKSIKYL